MFRCSASQQQAMTVRPSAEEISSVLLKINPNKSSGPDGFTSGFFKAVWPILGLEVTNAITHFFSTGFLPSSANATILCLVPKFIGASAISDFKPISCCTTLYKTISKLLVVRLKSILPDLILPNQTAFIHGRLLLENTVLASEFVNNYHKDKGPKHIFIKVDIAKVFDTLRWDFLLNCLQGLCIPNQYIK